MTKAIINTDGGSRGNPGISGIGIVICDEYEDMIFELGQYIGVQTNNYAEYKALTRALEIAIDMGIYEVEVYMDSELVVKQIKGEYKVKSENLYPMYEMANALIHQFSSFDIKHVKREFNKRADKLANKAMDCKGVIINK